jgi:hypothetical protein
MSIQLIKTIVPFDRKTHYNKIMDDVSPIMIDVADDTDSEDDDKNDNIDDSIIQNPIKKCRLSYLSNTRTIDDNRTDHIDSNNVDEDNDNEMIRNTNDSNNIYDDIEIIEVPSMPDLIKSDVDSSDNNDDNEVVFIGVRNLTSYQPLPHTRRHCPVCIFPSLLIMNPSTTSSTLTTTDNESKHAMNCIKMTASDLNIYNNDNMIEKYCPQCYCLVCDTTVDDCSNWSMHCMATDIGPLKEYWLLQRQQMKNRKVTSTNFNQQLQQKQTKEQNDTSSMEK